MNNRRRMGRRRRLVTMMRMRGNGIAVQKDKSEYCT
jgi:hypothetical protein